jgi:outer membrane receptor protein involved in Fe transport
MRYFIIITVLLLSLNAYNQTSPFILKGRLENHLHHPLPAATISLIDQHNKTVQKISGDSIGFFHLSYDIKGNYSLAISHAGYKEFKSETFQLTDKDFGIIQLAPADTLSGVTVSSKQNLIEVQDNTIIYNIAKSIDAQGLNAFEAFRKAPGVYVDNETTITLNGKQGALILLDGKQTHLSGKELIDLLKSMPASGLKSIEIISTPGAKYDASGSAGIINIKTNRSQVKGFNGTAGVGIAYGLNLRNSGDFIFNYRKSKVNIYGSYNHFIGNYTYIYGTDRSQLNKSYFSLTDDTDKRNKMGARFGFDYNINKKHTIGFLFNSNFIFGGGITQTKTDIGPASNFVIEQKLDAENDYYFQRTSRYNINLNYQYEDSFGNTFNVDADYGHFNKGNGNLQSNIYSDNINVLNSNLYRSTTDIGISLKALKADYTTNLGIGKLETGFKLSAVTADNDAKFFHIKNLGDSLDDRRTNAFKFDEQIAAAYLSYRMTKNKWSLQGGLRLEDASSTGNLHFLFNGIDSSEKIKRHGAHLFPSFSISVKPTNKYNLSFGYSRRIDRPAYQDLNPFIYLLDDLSFWQGNPFLQPQMTHRFSLQYTYKSSTILSMAYAHSDQFSLRITDTLDNNKIIFVQRNLGVQKNLSFSLTQNLSLAKWWNITFNGSVYHLHNLISLDKFRNFELRQLSARFNLQQTFKLPFKISGEITSFYTSRRLTGANAISYGLSYVDFALQRKLLTDKATIRIAFNDIYKGNQPVSVQNNYNFYLRSYGYYESRQVRISFTYRFADNTVKGPRNRVSALESESGRIK